MRTLWHDGGRRKEKAIDLHTWKRSLNVGEKETKMVEPTIDQNRAQIDKMHKMCFFAST